MMSEDYKKGYIQGITEVFELILSEMDDELKGIVLNKLNLKQKQYE